MLDHLDDLASDLSAVHGITDMGALPGPVFFKLAHRVAAYPGVMQHLVAGQSQGARVDPPPAAPQPAGDGREMVGGTRAELMAEPAFAGLLSFGTMSR